MCCECWRSSYDGVERTALARRNVQRFLMAIFSRRKAAAPDWLPQVRDFCRTAGIEIMAWGPQTIIVKAQSPETSSQIAAQLANLGFKVVTDDGDAYAGILTLSREGDA